MLVNLCTSAGSLPMTLTAAIRYARLHRSRRRLTFPNTWMMATLRCPNIVQACYISPVVRLRLEYTQSTLDRRSAQRTANSLHWSLALIQPQAHPTCPQSFRARSRVRMWIEFAHRQQVRRRPGRQTRLNTVTVRSRSRKRGPGRWDRSLSLSMSHRQRMGHWSIRRHQYRSCHPPAQRIALHSRQEACCLVHRHTRHLHTQPHTHSDMRAG